MTVLKPSDYLWLQVVSRGTPEKIAVSALTLMKFHSCPIGSPPKNMTRIHNHLTIPLGEFAMIISLGYDILASLLLHFFALGRLFAQIS